MNTSESGHIKAPRRLPVSLALRNLLRHRRRTALALAAIGFGVIALLLAGGFIEWIFWAMRESTIRSQLGHIQVVRPGYFEEGGGDPFAYLLPKTSPQLALIENSPHVDLVAPRLAFTGLISHGDTTVSFVGQGVEPAKEKSLSEYLYISEGGRLSPDGQDGVVLGAGLARNVGVQPGDTVILLATTGSGGINAVETEVRGLSVSSAKAFDDAALRVPIEMARTLLRVSGAHQWVVLLDSTAQTDAVLADLQARLSSDPGELEVSAWHERADFYNKTVVLFSRQLSVLQIIIGLIIVLSISNVLVMGVMERTSEIGTLMALGMRRRKVLRLFVAEGTWLGIAGGLIGTGMGILLAYAINLVGIPMPPPPGMDVSFTGEILLTPELVVTALLLALSTTFVASLYPAWKASRLEIVDALRYAR